MQFEYHPSCRINQRMKVKQRNTGIVQIESILMRRKFKKNFVQKKWSQEALSYSICYEAATFQFKANYLNYCKLLPEFCSFGDLGNAARRKKRFPLEFQEFYSK